MKNPLSLLCAAGLATILTAGSAFAAYPASVVSTGWVLRGNNTINIALKITSQGNIGPCNVIAGTTVDNGNTSLVNGYYCPATGRISFLRTSPSTGLTSQVYTGQVIVDSTSPSLVLEMEGSFAALGGANGAYPFAASDAPPPIIQ